MVEYKFAGLRADVDLELKNLSGLVNELKDNLNKISSKPTLTEIRAAGSILHDFYTGAEKIFEHIANKIDKDLPGGEDWHIQLLKRMTIPVPNIRPAIINKELGEILGEYLSFRHLFRNIYGFELKWERCKNLALKLEQIYQDLNKQLQNFLKFLEGLAV